jgi:hypothetical protein
MTRRGSTPVTCLYEEELQKAKNNGFIKDEISVDHIIHTLQVITIGNTFTWCINNGNRDLKYDMKQDLRFYLDSVFSDSYFAVYPKAGI